MCKYADTIVKIVAGTHEQGLLLYLPNVNDFIRDIRDETGVVLIPKQQFDYYDSQTLDRWGEPYINKRINKRKHIITMPSTSLSNLIVVRVGQVEQVTDSFRKRELIVTADNDQQYPQTLKFEAIQNKCDDEKLNEIIKGDEITVHFNINGREYTDKQGKLQVMNSLQLWKIDITRTVAGNRPQTNTAPQHQAQQAAPQQQSQNINLVEEDDDLPF